MRPEIQLRMHNVLSTPAFIYGSANEHRYSNTKDSGSVEVRSHTCGTK
jgi:hypothetical protein